MTLAGEEQTFDLASFLPRPVEFAETVSNECNHVHTNQSNSKLAFVMNH